LLKENGSDRVFLWQLLNEKYGVTFEYIPGKKNVGNVEDALSRLDIDKLKIQIETEKPSTFLSG
jgi:hypothetical protein